MARVEYKKGVACKKCGNMEIPPFYNFLCQSCGAELIENFDGKLKNRVLSGCYTVTNNAVIATIKVTHKLFHNTYEMVY